MMTMPEHLEEKAEAASTLCRVIMDSIELAPPRKYPQILISPNWSSFKMLGVVCGCFSLSLRLHFDVPTAYRTPLELILRSSLEKGFPDSRRFYEDCARFVREKLLEIERPQRGSETFVIVSTWMFGVLNNGDRLDAHDELVANLASMYKKETSNYWVESHAS